MSKVVFDGPNKLIYVISGSLDIEVKSELYSEWKRWIMSGSNSKYLETIRTVGGDPISQTLELGDTYFLRNGWRIRPYDGTYQLTIEGNLYDEDGDNILVPPIGSLSNVLARLQTSNLIQTNIIQQPEILEIQTDVIYISESIGDIGTATLDPAASASIANIENQTTDISQSITPLQTDVTYISESMGSIEANLPSDTSASISNIETDMIYVSNSISNVNDSTNTLTGSVEYLTSSVSNIDDNVNQLTESLEDVEGYVIEISGSLVIVGENVVTIGEDVTVISSSLVTLSGDISNIDSDILELSSSLELHRTESEDRIKYILGLSQQNFRMKDQIYDVSNNMVSATVRIYELSSDATSDTNHLKQYAVSSSYTGDLLTSYTMTEI